MVVMDGYKMTEVGVIPVDWDLRTIGDLIQFQGGSQPPRDTFRFSPKEEYIRLLQIRDYKTDKYKTYIPINLARKFCGRDDIMIGRYGPPVFQILNGLEGAYNVALIKAIPSGNIDKKYAFYVLKQKKLFDFIDLLSQRSSGQTGVDLIQLKNYQIPFPPTFQEQQAIATALSDMDALLQSLDQLIAKKRAIKQGAMQDLLTAPEEGGKRLSGFSGAWEVKKLGEIAPLQRGFDLPSSQIIKGNYPIVYSNGITNYHKEFKVKAPGVVTGRSGTIGNVHFIQEDYWPHNTSLWVTTFFNNYPKFIYFLYTHIKLDRFGTGSGVPTLNRNDVHDFKIAIPPKEEQTAIAQILSDMDSEIESLAAERAKYQAMKEGMMQNLLTGKIRLI